MLFIVNQFKGMDNSKISMCLDLDKVGMHQPMITIYIDITDLALLFQYLSRGSLVGIASMKIDVRSSRASEHKN